MTKQKTKRIFRHHILTLALLLIALSALPVQASSVYLSEHVLNNGSTVYWYPANNTSGWSIKSNTSVKISITLSSAETNVDYGLRNSSGTNTLFSSFGGGNTSATTKTIYTSGYYRVYVQNNSASRITIKNSSYINF